MVAEIVEQDVPVLYIAPILAADTTLMTMPITVRGIARTLQGVFDQSIPQELDNPYPCIVIQSPYQLQRPGRAYPNGPPLQGAAFGVDVTIQARDVDTSDVGYGQLRAARKRIKRLLEGTRGLIDGGKAATVWVESYPPFQREDKGNYIFTQLGITFGIGAEVG
jgi:hypothetical protein